MHLQFIIPALLFSATQAAPNSYLEKAKSVLTRSNIPCFSWIGGDCASSHPQFDTSNILTGTPTENFLQDDSLDAPQPVPASAPEIANSYLPSVDRAPASPAPVNMYPIAKPVAKELNPETVSEESKDGSSEPKKKPNVAVCSDYKRNCRLWWTDANGQPKSGDFALRSDGRVCSDDVDSNRQPKYCAKPHSTGQ